MRGASLAELHRTRPRSRFARASALAMLALVALSWSSGAFDFGTLLSERAHHNLMRFLQEIRPYPLQHKPWDWGVAVTWMRDTAGAHAVGAIGDTLALSVAAIVVAAGLALLASLLCARNIASAEPFLPRPRPPSRTLRLVWGSVAWSTRLLLVLLRAIPEYVWAFLLLTLLGPGAWPAVLALALHNSGILGRLFGEVVEDADPRAAAALRGLGASRLEVAASALWPASLGRFLLLFFYRWETCVREATILGLLGFAGIGAYILQAQAAIRFDELLLWTLTGSLLILAGDALSGIARRSVRA